MSWNDADVWPVVGVARNNIMAVIERVFPRTVLPVKLNKKLPSPETVSHVVH
jgi:hypothetical protein